jgi:hypothetical protein
MARTQRHLEVSLRKKKFEAPNTWRLHLSFCPSQEPMTKDARLSIGEIINCVKEHMFFILHSVSAVKGSFVRPAQSV